MDIIYLDLAYTNNVNFRTDNQDLSENYLSGCNDIEVTSELDSYLTIVDSCRLRFKASKASIWRNYAAYKDSNVMVDVICEKSDHCWNQEFHGKCLSGNGF